MDQSHVSVAGVARELGLDQLAVLDLVRAGVLRLEADGIPAEDVGRVRRQRGEGGAKNGSSSPT